MLDILAIRRHLHQYPEISHQEFETTKFISSKLQVLGLKHNIISSKNGIICDIINKPNSSFIAFRADIDALKLDELTGLEYSSKNKGVAHACGHDFHISMLLGLAQELVNNPVQNNIRLIWQPAEESHGDSGAETMIMEKALENVEAIYALHIEPKLEVGKIGTLVGPITAAVGFLSIELDGKDGHTSRPHLSSDVISAISNIALELPSLLSKRVDKRSVVNLTWGKVISGTKANIVPASAYIEGTLRIFDYKAWKEIGPLIKDLIDALVTPYELALGEISTPIKKTVNYIKGLPPVINSEVPTNIATSAASKVVGVDNVITPERSMGGEDFAYYLEKIPGTLIRLGCHTQGTPSYDIHSAKMIADEKCINIGIQTLYNIAAN